MRAIGFAALLFLASSGIAAQGEDIFAVPQPLPPAVEPAANPNRPSQAGQLPITLTAQIFYLENATNIALETQEISKIEINGICLTSDQEFEVFLKKLTDAGAIRENNAVTFFLTEGGGSTPIECSSNVSTPAGERSFQMALSASILPPSRKVRADLQLKNTLQAGPKAPRKLNEVAIKFDVERGKSLVIRLRFPEQDGKRECLVRITQEPRLDRVLYTRSIASSHVDPNNVKSGE